MTDEAVGRSYSPNVRSPTMPMPNEHGGIPFVPYAQIKLPSDGQWLIKGILPEQAIILLHGHPAAGKSFLALDIALHVALGRPWFGRAVQQSGVAYVVAEAAFGFNYRVEAWRQQHCPPSTGDCPFGIIPSPLDLSDAKIVVALVTKLQEEADRRRRPFGLVVIDTLSMTFGGRDENGSEMAGYIANLRRVQVGLQCSVVVLHHPSKDPTKKTPRGHGSLTGNVEAILFVENKKPGLKTLTVEKQKDGPDGAVIAFELDQVEIGRDGEGDPITSCIVKQANRMPGPTANTPRVSPIESNALRSLRAALIADGFPPPPHIRDLEPDAFGPDKVVQKGTWREAHRKENPDTPSDTADRQISRAQKQLKILGVLDFRENLVWLCRDTSDILGQ